MTETRGPARVKFGNWIPVRSATLGGLTIPGWAVLLGSVVAFIFSAMGGRFLIGLAAVGLGLLFNLLFVIRFGGEYGLTIANRLAIAVGATQRIGRGEARFNSGLFSNLPADALTSLPGALGAMEEIDVTDGRGVPVTLLHHPQVRTLTAVFACNPDGTDMQAQAKVDTDVAYYGAWIASLSNDTGVAGAAVIVDSALRSSEPLVEKIHHDIDPEAPAIARQHVAEAAAGLPARYAEISTWVSVSWHIPALAGNLEDAVAEVAAKIPYHEDQLREAGGGSVQPALSEMLATAVRIAYRPDRSSEIASDALRGHQNGLRVTQAGPELFDDSQRRVVLHDGVASMSVLVVAPPRLHITETTLSGLFQPSDRFLRKRVATYYRPLPPAKTIRLVERVDRNASMMATAKDRRTSRDDMAMQHAKKLENEVISGASMTQFSMAVTVTFEPDARAYREAELKLKSVLDSSSLQYRFCEHDGSAAFHATLPLGIVPWLYESQIETFLEAVS